MSDKFVIQQEYGNWFVRKVDGEDSVELVHSAHLPSALRAAANRLEADDD